MRCLFITAYVILLIGMPACARRTLKKKLIVNKPIHAHAIFYPTPPITIWIHGTHFFQRALLYSFFNERPCLRAVNELDNRYYLHQVAHTINAASPSEFPLETFYVFGWSGKLNMMEREQAAEHLYDQLSQIIQSYEAQYHAQPHIRIITHSHGGNIALNLARIQHKKQNLNAIDELILLACPVQKNTQNYIEDPFFKKTYSFYSSIDLAQVVAPQLTHQIHTKKKGNIRSEIHWPPLSSKRFNNNPKLIQARIKLNGRALFHTEFNTPHFAHVLPHILHTARALNEHIEHKHLMCVYTNRIENEKKHTCLTT